MTVARLAPSTGLDPTPAQARDWLSRELHGPDYQESWLTSVIRWLSERVSSALHVVNGGHSLVITVLVALLVIALLVWVVPRIRRESLAPGRDGPVLEDLTITARIYRDRATQALRDGRFDDAVLDGFRAIAKDMSDRTLLDDSPGRTAHEASLELAKPFPDHAGPLARAADLFDSVRYGHRRATTDQAAQMQQLDAELVTTRPVLTVRPRQDLSV